MDLQEQIATFAAEAATRTGRSKLEPYERLIRTLRQKRWTYAEISTALRERFQVSAAPGTVHSFMKVRISRINPPDNTATQAPSRPARRFHLNF